jgi:hypothetical protein
LQVQEPLALGLNPGWKPETGLCGADLFIQTKPPLSA